MLTVEPTELLGLPEEGIIAPTPQPIGPPPQGRLPRRRRRKRRFRSRNVFGRRRRLPKGVSIGGPDPIDIDPPELVGGPEPIEPVDRKAKRKARRQARRDQIERLTRRTGRQRLRRRRASAAVDGGGENGTALALLALSAPGRQSNEQRVQRFMNLLANRRAGGRR